MIITHSHNPETIIGCALYIVGTAVLAPILLISFGKRLRTKDPALGIYEEGIAINFLMIENPMLLPWEDVACVYCKSGFICILPADHDRFIYGRPWWVRYLYLPSLTSYGTVLAFSPRAVDIGWDEFAQIAGKFTKVGTPVEGGVAVPNDPKPKQSAPSDQESEEVPITDEEVESFLDKIRGRLTLDGKLLTIDGFRTHFQNHLIGTWTTAVGTYSPTDMDLVLYDNGTGYLAANFYGKCSGEFAWRAVADRVIEIRNASESQDWRRLTWEFTEEESFGKPAFCLRVFEADPAGDSSETWEVLKELCTDRYTFQGLPRKSGLNTSIL